MRFPSSTPPEVREEALNRWGSGRAKTRCEAIEQAREHVDKLRASMRRKLTDDEVKVWGGPARG